MSIYLKPDRTTVCNGVTVKEYLLTNHNPNRIAMPTISMKGKVIGVTIHNTEWIGVNSATTPAEQYTRATVNGNMNDVRVHYYVDNVCAWQNLPLWLSGWHAADGSGNGNRKTIAIECIMSSGNDSRFSKSEDNAARLAAYLLKQYGLGINNLYTHTHWLNVKNGKTGNVDYLNTTYNSYKMCPAFILPHWSTFKKKVENYLKALNGGESVTPKPTPTPTPTPSNNTKLGVYKVTGDVNVRSGPGTSYKINMELKTGGVYTIVEIKNGWGKLKSGAGWVSMNYMKYYSSETSNKSQSNTNNTGIYKVTIDELNIRSGPGTNYKVVGSIKKNEAYTLVEFSGAWGKLKSGAGWVYVPYMKKI